MGIFLNRVITEAIEKGKNANNQDEPDTGVEEPDNPDPEEDADDVPDEPDIPEPEEGIGDEPEADVPDEPDNPDPEEDTVNEPDTGEDTPDEPDNPEPDVEDGEIPDNAQPDTGEDTPDEPDNPDPEEDTGDDTTNTPDTGDEPDNPDPEADVADEPDNPDTGEEPDNPDTGEDAAAEDNTSLENDVTDAGDTDEQMKKIEDEINKNLNNKQIDIRVKELKGKYIEVYNICNNINNRVEDITKTDDNGSTIDFIISKINETKIIIYDYLSKTFNSKTYIENLTNYNQYLVVLSGIKKLLNEIIQKNDESKKKS